MKKGAKIGIGAVAVAAVIGLSVVVAMREEESVLVKIEPVATRDLVAIVNASGWIRPNRRVDVQADIMGRITELNVQEGEAVRRGQVLLRIDPTQYEAAVGRAEAAVSEALSREAQTKAGVLQAERQHTRLQQLAQSDQNLVSRQQLEEAETNLAVQRQLLTAAGFGIQQARSAVDEARDRLSKTIIRAPMDGVITRLNVEEGSTAIVGTMNNPGSLLLTVADLSTMEAVVRVDETDLPDIHLGDSASIAIDAFPRQKFTGKVTKISYSAVRSPLQQGSPSGAQGGQAIDYEIVITLDNPPPALRSDLSVAADVVTAKRAGVLSIPIIALTVRERGTATPLENEDPQARAAAEAATQPTNDEADEEGVFVVRAGKAHFVPVKVGIAGDEHFEVVSGLTVKDSVVAGPYEAVRSLEEGKAVRPMPTTPATTTRAGNSAPTGGQ
jgi:HlyD family secretion protein